MNRIWDRIKFDNGRHFFTSKKIRYWKNRDINWQIHSLETLNHPHRKMILQVLKTFRWASIWEVGCAAGPNLVRIYNEFKGANVGGSDVNEKAIELARKTLVGAPFEVSSGDDILMSDKSCDVILTDMILCFVDPFKIKDYLLEFKRIARNRLILVELHSDKWWERLWLRLGGTHVYNYLKLLEGLGFYDVIVYKMPDYWKGPPQNKYAHIISAKII